MMKNWLEALTFVDDRYVEEANPQEAQPMRKLRRAVFVRRGAWVACLLLVVLSVSILLPRNVQTPPVQPPAVPQFQNPLYSAEEIASMFATYEGGTSSYQKVCAPHKQYLYLNPVPEESSTFIYKREQNAQGRPLDEGEFTSTIDTFLQNYAQMTNSQIPAYTVKESEDIDDNTKLNVSISNGATHLFFHQSKSRQSVSLYPYAPLFLNGVRIEIDSTQSDEEILAFLAPIREQLFALFNVSFDTMEISSRYYDSWNGELSSLGILFYNKETGETPIYFKDRIQLTFNYTKNSGRGPLQLHYDAYRTPLEDRVERQRVTQISLEDAERLLYNGYVFGGHTCPICMAAQDKVDFTNYDFVSYEYVTIRAFSDARPASDIPFYTFYKKIDTLPNGCNVYAKTYVPAIEVSGYEEYFEKQQEKHP
ncbi:MAG: hypothetical protein IKV74_04705 [Clostridia bacterium]|nr:hypothetical protein [Clostridia bacterium]